MKENGRQEIEMRRFLLGDLAEDERSRMEQLFLADSAVREQLLIAEDDLIEDYLDGSLSVDEQRRFKQHFASTPQQRSKIMLARLLHTAEPLDEDFSESVPATSPEPVPIPKATKRFWHRPLVLLPMSAVLILIIGFGIFQGVRSLRLRNQRIEAENRRRARESELVRLNSRPRQATGPALSVTLLPVSPRSPGQRSSVAAPGGIDILELHLVPTGPYLGTYRVELRLLGSPDSFAIPDLIAEGPAGKETVVVRLPTTIDRGDYVLTLTPVSNQSVIPGEYQFHFGD